jgi:hypothetical protein
MSNKPSSLDDITVKLGDYNDPYTYDTYDTITLPPLSIDDIETFDLSNMNSSSSITLTGGGGGTSYNYPGTSASTAIYTSPTISISPNTYSNVAWNPYNTGNVQIQGDANIDGTLKVKGVDIGEMLSKIQDQLAIYQPAPELEEKWEELRELARKYKELVADIKEKEKIWSILQK